MKLSVIVFFLFAIFSLALNAAPAKLQLAGIDGKEYSLADYRGNWVVVNYWATWCSPCLKEIPEFNKLHEKGKKSNVRVLGVNFEEATEKHVKSFVEKYNITYPVLLEEFDVMSQLGMIEAMPKTFIISPKGEIVYEKLGIVSLQFLENILTKLQKN